MARQACLQPKGRQPVHPPGRHREGRVREGQARAVQGRQVLLRPQDFKQRPPNTQRQRQGHPRRNRDSPKNQAPQRHAHPGRSLRRRSPHPGRRVHRPRRRHGLEQARRRQAALGGRRPRDHARRCLRAGVPPRATHRPPRHQARQSAARGGRHGQARRSRRGKVLRGHERRRQGKVVGPGHPGVHRPRALYVGQEPEGAGGELRRGCVELRGDHLLHGVWTCPLPGEERF
mmetsp:Transcript_13101/g.33230  ORF Transcript_13101/g.33230 Transcript_13101/m.33230 type:complete len:231 (-) Transcript_13101:419-1111(-)